MSDKISNNRINHVQSNTSNINKSKASSNTDLNSIFDKNNNSNTTSNNQQKQEPKSWANNVANATNEYMAAHFGKDWQETGTITTDGYAEQTGFLACLYGVVVGTVRTINDDR